MGDTIHGHLGIRGEAGEDAENHRARSREPIAGKERDGSGDEEGFAHHERLTSDPEFFKYSDLLPDEVECVEETSSAEETKGKENLKIPIVANGRACIETSRVHPSGEA